jgi:hypothetical protein
MKTKWLEPYCAPLGAGPLSCDFLSTLEQFSTSIIPEFCLNPK